jgi:heat-inducible transcriptional repressor
MPIFFSAAKSVKNSRSKSRSVRGRRPASVSGRGRAPGAGVPGRPGNGAPGDLPVRGEPLETGRVDVLRFWSKNWQVADLSKRERAVLSAVVTEFTATGEPVSSRVITRKYGFDLSPATIRNVMADLEEQGYLSQPHASSGRVPTEKAFRLFIDALMRLRQLSDTDATRIASWFGDLPPGSDLLRGAGRLLSDMTGAAAVMLRCRIQERTLTTLRFIRTRPTELLAVLVCSDGAVENRFVSVEEAPSDRDLERLHNMLGDVVAGRTLASVRDHFARMASEQRDEIATLRDVGAALLTAAMDVGGPPAEVLIEGQAKLLDYPELSAPEVLRDLVRGLEDRERLVELLDGVITTRRVQVMLGDKTRETVGYPVSLIAAPYGTETGPAGVLGVIGPTPMDYPMVIPVVRATAEAMSAAVAKGRT